MTDLRDKRSPMDVQQVVYLGRWLQIILLTLLGFLTVSACASALIFLFSPGSHELVVPLMSIAQTLLGAFAVIMFVLFAEKQPTIDRLHEKTNQFLEYHVKEGLSRIELPQVEKERTVSVNLISRGQGIHGRRKDIYGANYEIGIGGFKMKLWVGINIKRVSIIYFVKADSVESAEELREIFKFTFGGAEKVGYQTYFEYAIVDGEQIVSIWSTVTVDSSILNNTAEQLFWVQDLAMMTQSFARTAIRHNINLDTTAHPGPL